LAKADIRVSPSDWLFLTLVVWKRSAFDDLRAVIPFSLQGDLRGWDEALC
jgi:hypothetical protein